RTKQYPLFYQFDGEYEVNVEFGSLHSSYLSHFRERLVTRKDGGKTYFYLKTVYDNEQYIASTIQELISAKEIDVQLPGLSDNLEKSAAWLKRKIGKGFDGERFKEERRRLYQRIPRKRLFVIGGIPGSGKSYELLKIVDCLARQKEKSLILT